MRAVKESLSLKRMKTYEMDYVLNRESEKFRRVDEAFQGYVDSVSMRKNEWK